MTPRRVNAFASAVAFSVVGAVVWAAVLFAVLGCAEPPVPPPVAELPAPCEYPMALNYMGQCGPTVEAIR